MNEFIAVIVDEWFDDAERTRFLDGLLDVDRRSQRLFGTAFLDATPAQQQALLRTLDAETVALRRAGAATAGLFWPSIKGLTLYGYFTSRTGADRGPEDRDHPRPVRRLRDAVTDPSLRTRNSGTRNLSPTCEPTTPS